MPKDWKIFRRLQDERDRLDRESEIAKCECGAQVRRDSRGVWQHQGPCKKRGN